MVIVVVADVFAVIAVCSQIYLNITICIWKAYYGWANAPLKGAYAMCSEPQTLPFYDSYVET